MNPAASCLSCLIGVVVAGLPRAAPADPPAAPEIGVRVLALKHDVSVEGAGIAARFPLRQDWFVDVTLERQSWSRDGGAGATGRLEVTTLAAGAAIGRRYRGERGPDWFWSWGLAAGMPEVAPGAVAAAASTEIHWRSSLGIAQPLATHWLLTAALRLERHYVDTRIVDGDGRVLERLSARTPLGLYVALSYRF